MRKLRWLNTFIIAACLIGQLLSFQILETPLSQEGANILTEARDANILTEGLICEAPLANQIAKANAILASSRLVHRQLSHQSPSVKLALHRLSNSDNPALLFQRRFDNRGPPLS